MSTQIQYSLTALTSFSYLFVSSERYIGDKNMKIDKTHPSINKIETNRTNKDRFFFKPINEDFVTKQINKLSIKKATGYDGISPKIIKFAQPVITNPIKVLINKSIDQSIFPEKLKAAQVSPLFKKNNSLDKSNYRQCLANDFKIL